MTYSISLTGHGAASDDVKEVLENAVRALRKVNELGIQDVKSGISNTAYLSGSAGGMGIDGDNFTMSVTDVADVDEDEVLDEEEVEDTDPEAETAAGTEPDA
jgi:hypothetical protein